MAAVVVYLSAVLHLLPHLCFHSCGVGGGFTAQHAHHIAQLHFGLGRLQQALPHQVLHTTAPHTSPHLVVRWCSGIHIAVCDQEASGAYRASCALQQVQCLVTKGNLHLKHGALQDVESWELQRDRGEGNVCIKAWADNMMKCGLQVCTDLPLFFTLFSPLFPDLLLLFGSEHEGHGWGGGLSHRGVQGDRVLNVYSDLILVDVPA